MTKFSTSWKPLSGNYCVNFTAWYPSTDGDFMISNCYDAVASIRLSVRPSLTLCIVALKVDVGGWKLYRRVRSKALPIHFFRHFSCSMYRLATIAVGCIVQPQQTAKSQTAEISASWIDMGSVVMWAFIAIPDAVRFCRYTVCRT